MPEETRVAIQELLPGAPITQIITGHGPIVFGRDDPADQAERSRARCQPTVLLGETSRGGEDVMAAVDWFTAELPGESLAIIGK